MRVGSATMNIVKMVDDSAAGCGLSGVFSPHVPVGGVNSLARRTGNWSRSQLNGACGCCWYAYTRDMCPFCDHFFHKGFGNPIASCVIGKFSTLDGYLPQNRETIEHSVLYHSWWKGPRPRIHTMVRTVGPGLRAHTDAAILYHDVSLYEVANMCQSRLRKIRTFGSSCGPGRYAPSLIYRRRCRDIYGVFLRYRLLGGANSQTIPALFHTRGDVSMALSCGSNGIPKLLRLACGIKVDLVEF